MAVAAANPRGFATVRAVRMVLRRCSALLSFLALSFLSTGCDTTQPIGPAESGGVEACSELSWEGPSRRSVVLVVSDTTRRDAIGAYGGRARTPAFDAFARSGVLFRSASTEAPRTKPAIASLFTSLHPSQHKVLGTPFLKQVAEREGRPYMLSDGLGPGFTTLAEVFREAGYQTAGFVSNPWLGTELGFAQGFDTYDDSGARWDAPGVDVSEKALGWLAGARRDQPFFLYVHFMDAHRPHPALSRAEIEAARDQIEADRRPVPRGTLAAVHGLVRLEDGGSLDQLDLEPNRALLELAYHKGVANFDRALGRLLDGIAALPETETPAIIVTSDHGEALFERGWGNHGAGLHDDETAIPLAARLPGVSARDGATSCPTGPIDVLPTLCTYTGVACPADVAGVSWLRHPDEPVPAPRYIVSEGITNQPRHRSIRNARFKLLYQPGYTRPGQSPYSLYDLETDPAERHDLLAQPTRPGQASPDHAVASTLTSALETAVAPFDPPVSPPTRIDPTLAERLEALGYLEAPVAVGR